MTGTIARTRTALLAAVPLAMSLVAGCGVTDIPAPDTTTVTVWVDPPAEAQPATPATTDAPPDGQTTAVIPTRLSGGHGRGAVTSYVEAQDHIEDADRTRDALQFLSPSGNIFCAFVPDGVNCEVAAGRTAAPQAGICAPDGPSDIGRIELTSTAARPVCNSDSIRASARKISYETLVRGGGLTVCLVEEAGVTCVDQASRHGFFLARGAFETF